MDSSVGVAVTGFFLLIGMTNYQHVQKIGLAFILQLVVKYYKTLKKTVTHHWEIGGIWFAQVHSIFILTCCPRYSENTWKGRLATGFMFLIPLEPGVPFWGHSQLGRHFFFSIRQNSFFDNTAYKMLQSQIIPFFPTSGVVFLKE